MKLPIKPVINQKPRLVAFFKGSAAEYLSLGVNTISVISSAAQMRESYRPIYKNI